MKLVSIDHSGFAAAAVLREGEGGDQLLPVLVAPRDRGDALPISVRDLLDDWAYWRPELERRVAASAPGDWIAASSRELLAAVPNPRTFVCIGLNYHDHAEETGAEVPVAPIVFAKHPAAVVGPDDEIPLPVESDEVDYEVELAIVIGRHASRVSEAEAMDAVAGFTIVNDVSARDWQRRTSQWMTAKSFPGFGPVGPVLVTAEEFDVDRPHRVHLELNGETMQDSSTEQLIFGVRELVAHLSSVWPLQPGDIIATGTPGGVGFTREPAIFLRPGDVVEASIEGIGTLRNTVVAAATASR
ncbi:fumarylacetoacetate hydrolase family protein [Homoserinibacter sp. YIM 151385]|uniref:fumarylacetoacetate hydrolase family protein n=1 Tax=Homoserinibacter sp. YIM 151385 TaxID=2985506 RepID=UPI0022F0D253|nr:fumarylacetoacetate hydrolase family protein [Homoserinibacter sp. YIM 151385]WBU37900.1 fumarylacetoacetate hydrolase family protein [Homoserinibacter sp. YIM 151385]